MTKILLGDAVHPFAERSCAECEVLKATRGDEFSGKSSTRATRGQAP